MLMVLKYAAGVGSIRNLSKSKHNDLSDKNMFYCQLLSKHINIIYIRNTFIFSYDPNVSKNDQTVLTFMMCAHSKMCTLLRSTYCIL
jgi:hypothetical protein